MGQEKGIINGSRAQPSQVLTSHDSFDKSSCGFQRLFFLPHFSPGSCSGSGGQDDAEDKDLGVHSEVQVPAVAEIPAGTRLGMVLSPPAPWWG